MKREKLEGYLNINVYHNYYNNFTSYAVISII